jgi:anaerobic sulfite reductase subunit B
MSPSELIPQPVKILDVFQESPDTYTFILDYKIKHDPGQFIQVNILGVGESPISISSYSSKFLKITVRVVGNVTRALTKLKKGEVVFVRGPYGAGYPLANYAGKSLILIGGGCGVAPLKGAIDYVESKRDLFKDIYLFLGYRSPDDMLFKREQKEWEQKYHIEVTVENAPQEICYTGKTGFVTAALTAFEICGPERFIACLCGPPVMINKSIEILHQKGIAYNQIYVSAERLMHCAIGKCCHCMVHGEFVCKDGPVFRYDQIKNYQND